MNRIRTIRCLTFALLVAWLGAAFAQGTPALGTVAPDFKLQDQNGKWHELKEFRGKWVALYFYPKDQTPGCTTQACEFRDNIFAFKEAGAQILGVSVDDVEYEQTTMEINVNYVMKQFNSRLMIFFMDTRFDAVRTNFKQVGVGVQLQM